MRHNSQIRGAVLEPHEGLPIGPAAIGRRAGVRGHSLVFLDLGLAARKGHVLR
jgi:hypothetical protein